jgi:hypothetical protein
MGWPLSQDYNEVIQDARTAFADPELRAGEVATNALGLPLPRSGNFADVYEVKGAGGKGRWAVKCFTRQVAGLRERYAAVSAHLAQSQLPFTVDFQYLEQGIRVRGQWYPVLKMQWVEGLLLNEFVRDNLEKPPLLNALSQIWLRMAKRLREASFAHADLQHGNVILVPGSTARSLAVKLIDYDGMFVPALAGKKSGEVGHPNYQHPQRLREGTYSGEVDRFPLLVVATALRALAVSGRALWERHDNGDNLLFKETDLRDPEQSPVFADLLQISDPLTQKLVGCLRQGITAPLEATPPLTELMPEERPAGVQRPAAVSSAAREGAGGNAWDFASEEAERPARRKQRQGGVPSWVWAAVAAVGIVLFLVVGLGAWMASRDKAKEPVAQQSTQKQSPPKRTPSTEKDPTPPTPPTQPTRPKRPKRERPTADPPPPLPDLPPPSPDSPTTYDPKAVVKARLALRERFKEEYARTELQEQYNLGRKLNHEANLAGGRTLEAYAARCEARDVAARAGDYWLLDQMAVQIARTWGISIAAAKGDALDALMQGTTNPGPIGWALREALYLIDIAVAEDDYEQAVRMVTRGHRAADLLNNAEQREAMNREAQRLIPLRKAYTQVKPALETLRATPTDPEANQTFGLFEAVDKGDWEEALPLLAKGKEGDLSALARKDLQTPDDPAAVLALADAWKEQGDRAEARLQTACWLRACQCYEEASLRLYDERRKEAETRLAALRGKVPGMDDPWSHVNRATCSVDAEGIHLNPPIWISTRQFYRGPIDLTVVGRTDRNNFRMAIFDNGRLICNWEGKPGLMGINRPSLRHEVYFNYASEAQFGPTAFETIRPLTPNQWYTIRWRIEASSMKLWVDGVLVMEDDKPNEVSVKRPVRIGSFDSRLGVKSLVVRRARPLASRSAE